MEIKLWVLGGAISILLVIIGVLFSLIKTIGHNFIFKTFPEVLTRLDRIAQEIHTLNGKLIKHDHDICELFNRLKELKEISKNIDGIIVKRRQSRNRNNNNERTNQ